MFRSRPIGGHTSMALACVVASILLTTVLSQKSVDCRKFVFAPSCRGIAAKRTTLEAISRRDSEDTEGSGNIRGRTSDEEDSGEMEEYESVGRRDFKDRRFGRKSDSSLGFLAKVPRTPSTYNWFSNDKQRRRNRVSRHRLEYRNYDY